jgi:hypothetical protein
LYSDGLTISFRTSKEYHSDIGIVLAALADMRDTAAAQANSGSFKLAASLVDPGLRRTTIFCQP